MRQQLYHRSPGGGGGGDGLYAGMPFGQPEVVTAVDELPQPLVAADLAGSGVIDHQLAGPDILQRPGIARAQRGEVLSDRIGLTRGARLRSGQLHRTDEVRKLRNLNPTTVVSPATYPSPSAAHASQDQHRSWRSANAAAGTCLRAARSPPWLAHVPGLSVGRPARLAPVPGQLKERSVTKVIHRIFRRSGGAAPSARRRRSRRR
jgi:hypothetical protein